MNIDLENLQIGDKVNINISSKLIIAYKVDKIEKEIDYVPNFISKILGRQNIYTYLLTITNISTPWIGSTYIWKYKRNGKCIFGKSPIIKITPKNKVDGLKYERMNLLNNYLDSKILEL